MLRPRRDPGVALVWIGRKTERLAALDEMLLLLAKSHDSDYSGMTVKQLRDAVQECRTRIQSNDRSGIVEMRRLMVVTGPLQETAIDNGWGDEFLYLADKIG